MMVWEGNVTRVPLAISMLLSRHTCMCVCVAQAARILGITWDGKE